MQLKYAIRGLAASMQAKARMELTGRTPNGHRPWTQEEDEKITQLYPDYKTLRSVLNQRSFYAIKARACTLGITKKRHCWTGAEISQLRRLYPKASHTEILDAFPDLRWRQISCRAQYSKIRRARKPYKTTGHAPIDDILRFAFENNLHLADIDAFAGTKKYFQSECPAPYN